MHNIIGNFKKWLYEQNYLLNYSFGSMQILTKEVLRLIISNYHYKGNRLF